jgi:hypothetical protein
MAQEGSTGLWRVGGLLMRNGVIQITGLGAPTNGTSGTAAGQAGPGSVYVDATNAVEYLNIGTKASPTWIISGGVQLAQVATVTLSAANILGMFATPVAILPAPGANKLILVDLINFQMKPGGTQFAGGGVVTFVYTGGAINPHSSNIPAATVNSASGSNNVLPPVTAVIQPPTNTGISITNATGAFTTGNGTAIVTIWFQTITLG